MGYVESLLATDEKIVFKTRQHWIVLFSAALSALFVVLVFIALAIVGYIWSSNGLFLSLLALALIPVFSFGLRYMTWWNEEYMLTNRRVIQAKGTINKRVFDSSLEKVNDVGLSQSFLGRLLGYGDVEIMTGSDYGLNKLSKIAAPIKFKTEMLNQKEAMGHDERMPHAAGGAHDIPAMIAELDVLRQQGVLTEAEFQQKKTQLLAMMK